MKTPEQVEALKQNWLLGGDWDIYETEGFEEYREELFVFQEQVEAESERRF